MNRKGSSRRPSASSDPEFTIGNQKRQASVYDAVVGIDLDARKGPGDLLKSYRACLLNRLHPHGPFRI